MGFPGHNNIGVAYMLNAFMQAYDRGKDRKLRKEGLEYQKKRNGMLDQMQMDNFQWQKDQAAIKAQQGHDDAYLAAHPNAVNLVGTTAPRPTDDFQGPMPIFRPSADGIYKARPKAALQIIEMDGPDGPGQYLVDKNNPDKKTFLGKSKSDNQGPSAPDMSDEQKLRKEFNDQAKVFEGVRQQYGVVQSAASNPSPAGDVGLIFAIMKMFDPGSVVREGEFATAANSGSVPERVRAQYNMALKGQRLSDAQRKDFVGTATRIYRGRLERFKNTYNRYSDLAQQYHIPSDRIVFDYSHGDMFAEPKPQPQDGNPTVEGLLHKYHATGGF